MITPRPDNLHIAGLSRKLLKIDLGRTERNTEVCILVCMEADMTAPLKRNMIPFFRQWLRETDNCDGLVESVSNSKRGLIVKLKDITEHIYIHVTPASVDIPAEFHNEWYDLLRSIDIEARVDEDGRYYCAQCMGDVQLYETEYELYVEHTFSQVREYLETIAQPGKSLVLRYKVNRYSDARIIDTALIPDLDMEDVTLIVDVCSGKKT